MMSPNFRSKFVSVKYVKLSKAGSTPIFKLVLPVGFEGTTLTGPMFLQGWPRLLHPTM